MVTLIACFMFVDKCTDYNNINLLQQSTFRLVFTKQND